MKTIIQNRTIQTTLVLAIIMVMLFLLTDMTFAQDPLATQAKKGVDAVGGNGGADLGGIIKKVVNFLLFSVGVLSVIMIIIGGIRYVISGGDPGATKSARDTILYAVVGLVVAFVAYGIVNFVTGLFT